MDLYSGLQKSRGEWITTYSSCLQGTVLGLMLMHRCRKQDVVMDVLIPAWIDKHRAGRSCKCSVPWTSGRLHWSCWFVKLGWIFPLLCEEESYSRTKWGRKGCLLRDNLEAFTAETNAMDNSRTSCRRVRGQPPASFLGAHLDSRVGNSSTHICPRVQLRTLLQVCEFMMCLLASEIGA